MNETQEGLTLGMFSRQQQSYNTTGPLTIPDRPERLELRKTLFPIDMVKNPNRMTHDPCDEVMTPLGEGGRLDRINTLLEETVPANPFQRAWLGEGRSIGGLDDYLRLPLLTKQQLAEDTSANPPFGTNLTYPLERYTHYHQTSGTTGTPLRILDTDESWDWWGRCWLEVFRAGEVTAGDVLFFAFSFAPSIGFWSAFKGAEMLGALLVPGGGATSEHRLRMIREVGATVLMCTPSYALHLAEIAAQQNVSLRDSSIHTLIHAGEPGASIPNTRRQIEQAWGAKVIDHAGATEIGAWGVGTSDGRGLYVNEDEFIAEVLDRQTLEPVRCGELGELVITNLGRAGWPVIRYRTGDVVRPVRETAEDGSSRLLLQGGVLGRVDDMVIIRGVNVFPSAIENLIRESAGLREYRVTARHKHHMDELEIELEADSDLCERVAGFVRERIGIRIEVRPVDVGSLPRWEAKNKRFVDARDLARE